MPWTHSRKSRLFSLCQSSEKGLHGAIETVVDFMQKLAIDLLKFRVMPLAVLQGLLRTRRSRPLFSIAQAHHVPVVQAPALALHELEGSSVLLGHLKFDLFAEQHRESLSYRSAGREASRRTPSRLPTNPAPVLAPEKAFHH